MSGKTEADSNHMVLGDGEHFFVRSLLQLPLTDGHSLTYSAWFEVDQATFQRVLEEWWAPTYLALTFVGRLANGIPGLEIVDSECALAVVNPDEVPFVQSVVGNPDVLTVARPHHEVLEAGASRSSHLPHALLDGGHADR